MRNWTLLVNQSPLFSCVHQKEEETKPLCEFVVKLERFWSEGRWLGAPIL